MSQFILLKQLFGHAPNHKAVSDWLTSAQFGDRLVSCSTIVCSKPVDESWEAETGNVLKIISLVLATRGSNKGETIQRLIILNNAKLRYIYKSLGERKISLLFVKIPKDC